MDETISLRCSNQAHGEAVLRTGRSNRLIARNEMKMDRRLELLLVAWLAGAALLVTPACRRSSDAPTGSREGGAAAPDQPARAQAPADSPPGTKDELAAAAARLWTARKTEDWDTTFTFEDPDVLKGTPAADYAAWKEKEEPFRYDSFELGRALVDGGYGWVEVKAVVAMRKMPDLPGRDVQRWERWNWRFGRWLPVPPQVIESFPESPALRDADQERRLRARFDVAWEARRAADYEKLYSITDPRQRAAVPPDQHQSAESKHIYVDARVKWVEVIGERGRVRGVFLFKPNDPSLAKQEPQLLETTEGWNLFEGEWYIDLRTPLQTASQGAATENDP